MAGQAKVDNEMPSDQPRICAEPLVKPLNTPFPNTPISTATEADGVPP